MRVLVRAAMALASMAILLPAVADAQGKPVVAVLYFDNNSIGRDARDFTECGKRQAATWVDTYLRNSRQGAKAAKEDKQSFDLSKPSTSLAL